MLLKSGPFFSRLNENITDDNTDIFEGFLLDKNLIEEFCTYLTDLVYKIDDFSIESIGHLILSILNTQDNLKT